MNFIIHENPNENSERSNNNKDKTGINNRRQFLSSTFTIQAKESRTRNPRTVIKEIICIDGFSWNRKTGGQ